MVSSRVGTGPFDPRPGSAGRIPFRADHVGSLLRPEALRRARAERAAGTLSAAALKSIEDVEIARAIRRQEDIGLRAVTDGEFRRAWWHLYFLAGFGGAELYDLDEGVAFPGVKTRPQGVRVTAPLTFDGHPMLDHFAFVRDHAKVVPKITIPSPSAMYGRIGRKAIGAEVYPDLDVFFDDLGRVYGEAVRAFADAGCRYLQLDEVFLAVLCDPVQRQALRARGDDPAALPGIYARMVNAAIASIPDDMTIAMHLCRGNFRSTFMASGGYEPIADVLFNQMSVHAYFMEFDTERAGGFEPLRLLPKDKKVVLGLVTTKTGRLENKDDIKRRIDEAARYVDLDRLCLSPQCGFASTEEGNVLAEDEQWAKLATIVEIAQEVWGGL